MEASNVYVCPWCSNSFDEPKIERACGKEFDNPIEEWETIYESYDEPCGHIIERYCPYCGDEALKINPLIKKLNKLQHEFLSLKDGEIRKSVYKEIQRVRLLLECKFGE